MSDRADTIARAIRSFVENPVTNLVKGLLLILIGLSEASHTLVEDVTRGHLRVGHGLILIGSFGILESLSRFIEGLESSKEYLDARAGRPRPEQPPIATDDGSGDRVS